MEGYCVVGKEVGVYVVGKIGANVGENVLEVEPTSKNKQKRL